MGEKGRLQTSQLQKVVGLGRSHNILLVLKYMQRSVKLLSFDVSNVILHLPFKVIYLIDSRNFQFSRLLHQN
jgi:hypothetical protein